MKKVTSINYVYLSQKHNLKRVGNYVHLSQEHNLKRVINYVYVPDHMSI